MRKKRTYSNRINEPIVWYKGFKTTGLLPLISTIVKAYGGVEYSQSLSNIEGVNYRVVTFEEGIHRTVETKL